MIPPLLIAVNNEVWSGTLPRPTVDLELRGGSPVDSACRHAAPWPTPLLHREGISCAALPHENEATHFYAMLAKREDMRAILDSYEHMQLLKRQAEGLVRYAEARL
jgi:hypothetical protein